MQDDELKFMDESDSRSSVTLPAWNILIVDDDKDVHAVTKLVLTDVKILDRPLSYTSAYSAKEAQELLVKRKFELIFLDVVMETDTAGLDLVEFIRNKLHDDKVRLIIRTGEPGSAPERMIIDSYDINDYKEKTDLSATKLYSTVRSSLLQYEQLDKLYKQTKNLQTIIDKKIEESKLQQQALFETNKQAQMGGLLNMIAHQWRQPLSRIGAVLGHIQVGISLESLSTEEIVPLVTSAEDYLQNLSKIINDFQNLYANEKNKRDLSINTMLKDTITILEDSFPNSGVNLVYQPQAVDRSYSTALKQVFTNILKNAYDEICKTKVKDGRIDIRTFTDEDSFVIEIEDNAGQTTPLEDNIFEPYVSTSETKNGKGLGLYISKMIVKTHCSGQIGVRNEIKGACFFIRLPLENRD